MEKENDEMLNAYLANMPVIEQEEDIEQQKSEEEVEADRVESERVAEEQKLAEEKGKEEEQIDTSKEDKEKQEEEDRQKTEQEELQKAAKEKESVDNSEWLKQFEEVILKKNEYKTLSAEQKALAYLKQQNPYLDEDDLVFKAAQEFGIGATELDPDLLTEEDKAAIRKQGIDRKKLMHEADSYFKEQSESLQLPGIPNPAAFDEDYKSYKEFVAKQSEQEEEFKKGQEKIFKQVDDTAIKIESIEIEPKITLDEREFSFKSEFKLDENKRKELAAFARDHVPTQEEAELYFPTDGKLNMEGYLSHLATIKFSKQIINAAVKEGIALAREEFVEKDLKNSTLRNNGNMQQSNREVDPEIAAMRL